MNLSRFPGPYLKAFRNGGHNILEATIQTWLDSGVHTVTKLYASEERIFIEYDPCFPEECYHPPDLKVKLLNVKRELNEIEQEYRQWHGQCEFEYGTAVSDHFIVKIYRPRSANPRLV